MTNLTPTQRANLERDARMQVQHLSAAGAPLWMAREVLIAAFDDEAEKIDAANASKSNREACHSAKSVLDPTGIDAEYEMNSQGFSGASRQYGKE